MKTEIDDFLKDIVIQNEISVIKYNLTKHTIDVEALCNEHKNIVSLLKENFFDTLVKENLIASDCIENIENFAQKMKAGVPSEECDVYMRYDEKKAFSWIHFAYKIYDHNKDEDVVAIITMKNIGDNVNKRLVSSLLSEQIVCGVNKGNSYFIVNIDDEIILNSYGPLAIKTRNYKEQINYIASMCADMSQKFRLVLSKDYLLSAKEKGSSIDFMDILIKDIDEKAKWFKVMALYTKHPLSKKNIAAITFANVDDNYRESAVIKYNATHDELTDVFNKRSFTDISASTLNKLDNSFWKALIFVDIDNFKNINDTFGHVIGDRVLKGVASGIKRSVREGDVIGRVGGDEFMILCSAPTLYDFSARLKFLNQNIKQSAQIEDVSVSIGVVFFWGTNNDFMKLYYLSDKAMYHAKRSGKNCYHIIDQQTNPFLSEIMLKMDDERIAHMMQFKTNNYMFAHNSDGKIFIDYITPKMASDAMSGKYIATIDNMNEFLSKADFIKLNELIFNSLRANKILEDTIKIKDSIYKVFVSNSSSGIVLGFQEIKNFK